MACAHLAWGLLRLGTRQQRTPIGRGFFRTEQWDVAVFFCTACLAVREERVDALPRYRPDQPAALPWPPGACATQGGHQFG